MLFRSILVDMGIPQKEIAVKTSKVDELGKADLLSRDCPIRYIITVNALKEGWDCPFAYILASLANKTSKVDVEQILGRILRQPYAKRHSLPLLNTSYVLTCSNDFRSTLEGIVKGLNLAGFSRKDFRVGEVPAPAPGPVPEPLPEQTALDQEPAGDADTFDDIHPAEVKSALEHGMTQPEVPVAAMLQAAVQQTQAYDADMEHNAGQGFIGGELGEMLNQNTIQPQFAEEAAALRDRKSVV